MTRPRTYGPKKRTRKDRAAAALMLATFTDSSPIEEIEARFAARVGKAVGE